MSKPEEQEPPIPMDGPDTFLAHNLRWLRVAITEFTSVAREQLHVMRDIRDELIMARKARENGGTDHEH